MNLLASPSAEVNTSPLSEEQRLGYSRDGYLILRKFFARDQIDVAAQEADGLLRRKDLIHTDNLRCRWTTDAVTGECVFETFDPVADLSPACGRLATDARLLAVVGALYGEEACLFKDKLIFKPSGANGYALHQDYIAWPTFPRTFLTVLVPMDPATQANGCTEVFSGYHERGCMSVEDGEYHELPIDSMDPGCSVKLELEIGDIALFGGFTPHRSAPNATNHARRQLYLSYNALSDGGPQRDRHYQEFLAWLGKKYREYGRHNVYFR